MAQIVDDPLLAGLNAGDPQAAAEAFVTFEPYLRMVIRRQLAGRVRAKFDSADIVQSVWADLTDGLRNANWTFQQRDQLRAFLVKLARNRLVDRLRQQRRALACEVALEHDQQHAPAAADHTVSENFYAAELWDRMLDVCPPSHARILKLKRDGASLDEIAAQTGLHKSSVRRILYDVGRLVARLRGGDARTG